MRRWTQFAVAATLCLLTRSAHAEIYLTAEVMPTNGLSGFETYRITATSNWGNVIGFDFTQVGSYGITGQLNHVNPLDMPTIFANQSVGIGLYDPLQDTHFLVNSDDVLSLFPAESAGSLHGAAAFIGDRQLTIGNSLPFLQITTSDAASVHLKGAFVSRRSDGEMFESHADVRLSDILLGAAPQVELLPIPVPEPIPDPLPPPNVTINPPPGSAINPNPIFVGPEPNTPAANPEVPSGSEQAASPEAEPPIGSDPPTQNIDWWRTPVVGGPYFTIDPVYTSWDGSNILPMETELPNDWLVDSDVVMTFAYDGDSTFQVGDHTNGASAIYLSNYLGTQFSTGNAFSAVSTNSASIPEPSALALAALVMLGGGLAHRRRS